MAISITLQGGTGDADACQRRRRIVPVPESVFTSYRLLIEIIC
jgi:hypothetical protein